MVLFGVDGDAVDVLHAGSFADQYAEERIQAWADTCPALVNGGQPMLSLGTEIITRHGHAIDNLFLDGNGTLLAVEMKRGRSPRDVVAQVLDYAAHVSRLEWPDVDALCGKRHGMALDDAFRRTFARTLDRDTKPGHRLAILAESYDPRAFDAALYLINGGLPLVLLQFTYIPMAGHAVLDVRSVLGTLPEPPVSAPISAGGAATEDDGYSAWLLGSVAQALPDIAQDQGWALRHRLNKLTLPFASTTWPLPLGDCQLRVDTYKQGAVSLRFSYRRERAPALHAFLEERRAAWVEAFPAAFEAPPYPTVFATLGLDLPRPAMGDTDGLRSVIAAARSMAGVLVPLLEAYFADQGGTE